MDVLGPLLEPHAACASGRSLRDSGQALLRGRYMAAVARMEHAGVPVDTAMLGQLRPAGMAMKLDLIREVDKDYGVYEGTVFKLARFAEWLADRGMAWPLTEQGQPSLEDDTFREMAKLHPEVAPLRELRHALSDLRLEHLAVRHGRAQSDRIVPVRRPDGTEHSWQHQIHLRAVRVAARASQAGDGTGYRLYRLESTGSSDCRFLVG